MSGRSRQGRKSAARRPGSQSSLHSRPAPESRGAGGAPGEQRGGDTQAGRAWGRRTAHVSMAVIVSCCFAPTCV